MSEKISTNQSEKDKILYTKPKAETAYKDSEISEADKNWKKYPYVSQGHGKLVEQGKLFSSSFNQCSAFVIKNPETKLGGLFHIADIDFETEHMKLLKEFFLNWLDAVQINSEEKEKLAKAISDVCSYKYPSTMKREEIAPRLKELGIGNIRTRLFAGNTGRYAIDSRLRDSLLSYLGVELEKTTVFEDYNGHWSILVDFDSNTVNVGIPYKDKVLEYDF